MTQSKWITALALACISSGCARQPQQSAHAQAGSAPGPTGWNATQEQLGYTPPDSPREAAHRSTHDRSPSGAKAHVPGRPHSLSTEARLVNGSAVLQDRIEAAITSKRFSDTVREFERDQAGDPDAQDITSHYRGAMERDLGGRGRLAELACGLSLCVGAIHTRDQSSFETWLERFFANPAVPSYSFGQYSLDLGAGGIETRFVFSIDPGVNAVSGRAQGRHRR